MKIDNILTTMTRLFLTFLVLGVFSITAHATPISPSETWSIPGTEAEMDHGLLIMPIPQAYDLTETVYEMASPAAPIAFGTPEAAMRYIKRHNGIVRFRARSTTFSTPRHPGALAISSRTGPDTARTASALVAKISKTANREASLDITRSDGNQFTVPHITSGKTVLIPLADQRALAIQVNGI